MIVPADMTFGDVEYERDWVVSAPAAMTLVAS
jgi:hypothetical protein